MFPHNVFVFAMYAFEFIISIRLSPKWWIPSDSPKTDNASVTNTSPFGLTLWAIFNAVGWVWLPSAIIPKYKGFSSGVHAISPTKPGSLWWNCEIQLV